MFRLCIFVFSALLSTWSSADDRTPNEVLDLLHTKAAEADYEGYMSLFSADAVFMGTDAAERWPISEFGAYVRERFSTGVGWTYHPRDRHLARSADGNVIWFDEIADGEKLGPCRGTGVLIRTADGWKIAHYSLTVLVPNEVVLEVVELGQKLDDPG